MRTLIVLLMATFVGCASVAPGVVSPSVYRASEKEKVALRNARLAFHQMTEQDLRSGGSGVIAQPAERRFPAEYHQGVLVNYSRLPVVVNLNGKQVSFNTKLQASPTKQDVLAAIRQWQDFGLVNPQIAAYLAEEVRASSGNGMAYAAIDRWLGRGLTESQENYATILFWFGDRTEVELPPGWYEVEARTVGSSWSRRQSLHVDAIRDNANLQIMGAKAHYDFSIALNF